MDLDTCSRFIAAIYIEWIQLIDSIYQEMIENKIRHDGWIQSRFQGGSTSCVMTSHENFIRSAILQFIVVIFYAKIVSWKYYIGHVTSNMHTRVWLNILITVYVVMREHVFKTCVVILKRPLQNHYTSLEDMLSRHSYLWMDHWQMESKGLLISKVNMSGSRASGECSKTKYFNLLITYR